MGTPSSGSSVAAGRTGAKKTKAQIAAGHKRAEKKNIAIGKSRRARAEANATAKPTSRYR